MVTFPHIPAPPLRRMGSHTLRHPLAAFLVSMRQLCVWGCWLLAVLLAATLWVPYALLYWVYYVPGRAA